MIKTNRREMKLVEGDPFNSFKIRQSERNINNTGLFEGIEVKLDESTDSNKATIIRDAEIKEKAKQILLSWRWFFFIRWCN